MPRAFQSFCGDQCGGAGGWGTGTSPSSPTPTPGCRPPSWLTPSGWRGATGRLVSALTSVVELSEDFTAEVIRCGTIDPCDDCGPGPVEEMVTQSSMLVVPVHRSTGSVGLMRTVGWSAEDNAARRTASLVGRGAVTGQGAFHSCGTRSRVLHYGRSAPPGQPDAVETPSGEDGPDFGREELA